MLERDRQKSYASSHFELRALLVVLAKSNESNNCSIVVGGDASIDHIGGYTDLEILPQRFLGVRPWFRKLACQVAPQ